MADLIGSRPALVIVNPRSSHLHDTVRRRTISDEVRRAVVRRTGREPDLVDGTHVEAITALGDLDGRPLVVAVGGDGTIREAAGALDGRTIPLAVVPTGTGNVLASAIRLRGVNRSLEVIRSGSIRRLDLGQARWGTADGVEDRVFTVAAGMGFDARVMAAAEHEWKRRLRFGAYVGAAVRELARLRPARFHIQADDLDVVLDGLLVLIANAGEIVPGRVGPRRPIDPADGRLELLVLGGRNLFDGIRGAADLLLRTEDLHGTVIRRSVTWVRIDSDPAQPVQTDGDAHPPAWLEARVSPSALSVLVPPG
jgi:diacylglycerol kinase (ATP)